MPLGATFLDPLQASKNEENSHLMSDMQQGGAAVLMERIAQTKEFSPSEWQAGATGLTGAQAATLHELLVDAVLAIANPFPTASGSSVPDDVWGDGCKQLSGGWEFAKCGLRVGAAWTDEALGTLRKTSGGRRRQ